MNVSAAVAGEREGGRRRQTNREVAGGAWKGSEVEAHGELTLLRRRIGLKLIWISLYGSFACSLSLLI